MAEACDCDIATYHVSANVSQYAILHVTRSALSGSQIPLEASSSTLALDARSMGTSRMTLAGSASARNTGTMRYAGAVRRGKKCLSSSRTSEEMQTRAATDKIPEAAADAMVVALAYLRLRVLQAE